MIYELEYLCRAQEPASIPRRKKQTNGTRGSHSRRAPFETAPKNLKGRKNKMSKKLLSILLALVMVLALLSVAAFAADGETTVSVTIADYAAANGWSNGVKYPTINLDTNVTVTAAGTQNTGKSYNSGKEWRIYQSDSGTVTVSVKEGGTISSVKITYSISNSGVLTYNGSDITSGTAVTVDAASATFGVGNTKADVTNGQVKITAIEVVYTAPVSTCEHSETNPATCTEPETCVACGEELSAKLGHDWAAATCSAPKTCTRCFTTEGVAEFHTYVKGVCSACGTAYVPAEGSVTVSTKIADYAKDHGWVNGTQYSELRMDALVTVTAGWNSEATNVSTAKYYTSGDQWRIYQSDGGTVTVTATENNIIASVKITYVSDKTGTLTYNGANIASGTVVEVNAPSITFGMGNTTADVTNGQARITDIEVVYAQPEPEVEENPITGSGTEEDPYVISDVDGLIAFRDSVNAGETTYSAADVYVVLGADIDMTGVNWVGIGSINQEHGFMGNFDGKTYKIKNLTITDPELDSDNYAYAGFFSITEGVDKDNQNTIKNLTIENVTISTTGHIVAAAVAYPYYTVLDNITVTGNINIVGGDYTAGVVAYTRRCTNASNLTISGNSNSTVAGGMTVGGVISDIQMNGGLTAAYSNFTAENITVSGTMHVGGISGIISSQTLNTCAVTNVTLSCDDARVGIVSGSLGGVSTVTNAEVENVSGATDFIGGTYGTGADIQASIGSTYYATLAEALAEGGEITLLKGITITAKVTVTKDVTLDLNGKTITVSGVVGSRAIVLEEGCTEFVLDANGGKIVSADAQSYGIIDVNTAAAVTVNGGTYDYDTNNGGLFKFRSFDSTVTLNNVTVETNGQVSGPNYSGNVLDVNGGTFKAENGYNVRNVFAFYIAYGEATFDEVTIDNAYIGAIENWAATVTVTDCDITVTGTNSAPYLSVALAVEGGGTMTVDGGTYSTKPAAASDANGQGNSHGSWTAGIMSSGGTLIINDGTFSNGVFEGTASNPRAVITVGADADYGDDVAADLQINGGTFNSIGNLTDCETIWGSETDPNNDYMPTMDITITDGDFTGVAGKAIGGCDPISTGNPVNVTISGGTYSAEHNIDASYLAEDCFVTENKDGTYTVEELTLANAAAAIGDTPYATLAEALTAAADGDVIELIWNEGNDPIAMNGAVFGKTVTITGTATVDWSKGFLFIGRGGEGNGKVIFENANLTSASDSASYGIHVSGREKDTTNKYDGTLEIKNSTIELDYLINKGTMTLDNSTLTVKNGFSVGGRPASETESGEDATATLTLNNGSTLIVDNHNGMGLGYEAIGVMDVNTGCTFECTQSFLVTAKGTLNVDGGTVEVAGTLTNNGTINITDSVVELAKLDNDNLMFLNGEITIKVEDATGSSYAIRANDGVVFNNSYVKGTANETMRLLGSATFNGGFECSYLQGHSGGVGGTVTIEKGTTVKATYGVEFSNNYVLNGGTIELSGGNASGGIWGMVFQTGTYTINTDLVVIGNTGTYAPIHFTSATATVNASISQTNSGGEPLYIDENSTVTLGTDAEIDVLGIFGNGKLVIDGTGLTAGEYANVKCGASGFTGELSVINNDLLKAEIKDGKIVLIGAVAKIGDTGFFTLAEAIDAAEAGETVVLLSDITLTSGIVITDGMDVTISGEGKTITGGTGVDVFRVEGGKLTLEAGLNVHATTDCCIYIRGGDVFTAANLTKADGSKYHVIQGNGNYAGNVTITGGIVQHLNPEKTAIYWPQEGKLTISGGEITGFAAVRIVSGSLEITGGILRGTGEGGSFGGVDGAHGDDTGEALTVEAVGADSGYELISSIEITGGTFISDYAAAVGSYANTTLNPDAVAFTGFISGGTFSSDPTDYLAEGYVAAKNADGTYSVVDYVEIAFDLNAGDDENVWGELESVTVKYGESLKYLPVRADDFDRAYYVFKGWFTAAEGGEEVTLETAFTESCTLYAHWELREEYAVMLAVIGQVGEDENGEAIYDYIVDEVTITVVDADGNEVEGEDFSNENFQMDTIRFDLNKNKVYTITIVRPGYKTIVWKTDEVYSFVGDQTFPEMGCYSGGMIMSLAGWWELEPVAKIGDVYYTSLAEAIAAAGEGDVVTLIKQPDFTGLMKVEGTWYYFDNGAWDTTFTGVYKHTDGYWYYVGEGVLDWDFTGLVKHTNGTWYYVEDGEINWGYTGVVEHTNGKSYFVTDGKIVWGLYGLYEGDDGEWYYLSDSVFHADYTGLMYNTDETWYYVIDGVRDWSYTGAVEHTNGKSYFVTDGELVRGLEGLNKGDDGVWYYLANSVVDTTFTGVYKHTDGYWYYVAEGVLDWNFTGLWKHTNGGWYYVEDGEINWGYTGPVEHTNGKSYFVTDGKIVWYLYGLYKGDDRVWYYLSDSVVDTGFTGLYKHTDGYWYNVIEGVLDWGFTGLVKHTNGSWYYVEDGELDWSFTGLVKHNGYWFYVEKGKLNWGFTGLVEHTNGKEYYVAGGKLNWSFSGTVDGKNVVKGVVVQ